MDDKLFQFQVPKGAEVVEAGREIGMAEFVLKYADGRGQIHQQVAEAGSEKELRDRYSQQGFLIYSIKPRSTTSRAPVGMFGGRRRSISRSS